MTSGRLSLFASSLFAATGVVLLGLGANLLWSAFVFVVSLVFLGFYLRQSYFVLRRSSPAQQQLDSSDGGDPEDN